MPDSDPHSASGFRSRLPDLIFGLVIVFCSFFLFHLQFGSAFLLDTDSYFHLALARFIKAGGFLKDFPWTQFSTMKDSFSDKDLLLHLYTVPFLWVFKSELLAGKLAAWSLGAGFFTAAALLCRRYLNGYFASVLALSLFCCPYFVSYSLYLRPAALAGLFTILSVYFLVRKNRWAVFACSWLYALAHISAFTVIYFAVLCEVLRKLRDGEFYWRNICFAAAGLAAGFILHPNFPYNIYTVFINGLMAPALAAGNSHINFAMELFSLPSKDMLLENFPVAVSFTGMLAVSFWHRPKVSFDTLVFAASALTYCFLAMVSLRFWYPAVALSALAAASFARDWFSDTGGNSRPRKAAFLLVWCVVLAVFGAYSFRKISIRVAQKAVFNQPLEDAAIWMSRNVPPGEIVFHSLWSDTPYLIYFNPRDYYLVVLDPVYMRYYSPQLQRLYQDMSMGTVDNMAGVIKETFGARYVFTMKMVGFYARAREDARFRLIYENSEVSVFEIVDSTGSASAKRKLAL